MRNTKKKVIATMLAFLMAVSPLQGVAFAEGPGVGNTYLAGMLKSVSTALEQGRENMSVWQKIGNWWSPDLGEKAFKAIKTNLEYKRYLEENTNITYPDQKVSTAVMDIYERTIGGANKGGLINWLKSVFLGPGSFMTMVIVMEIVRIARNFYRDFKTKWEAGKVEKPVNPAVAMQVLDMLMKNVKGQEKAKQQIRSIALNIVDKNAQFMDTNNGKKAGPGADVIYMVGPSGVGKSFSADIIRKVLNGFNAEPFVIEASDIDKQSKSSAVEQLFGMKVKRVNNSEVYEYAPFIQRIKAIPNTTVVINEYDKMHTPELDEKLRTIMDQGYINVNGEKIDCSAATFIITSNESYGSVNKGNNELDHADDGTGSRTFVNHDKAFLNRIKLIEFDNLTAKEYKEIALAPFVQLALRYRSQYGINLDLNGTVDAVAQRVEELNRGARPIFTYLESLNDKLLNEVVLQKLNYDDRKINYKVSFEKDSFILEPLDDNGEVIPEDTHQN